MWSIHANTEQIESDRKRALTNAQLEREVFDFSCSLSFEIRALFQGLF